MEVHNDAIGASVCRQDIRAYPHDEDESGVGDVLGTVEYAKKSVFLQEAHYHPDNQLVTQLFTQKPTTSNSKPLPASLVLVLVSV